MLKNLEERFCALLVDAVRKDPELAAELLDSYRAALARIRGLESPGRRWPAPPEG
jgi:hypothetical protein